MTKAAIYIHTYHHWPPELVAEVGEPAISPLDVQERVCRTYCERMGYAVLGVYCATAKPPEGVPARYLLEHSFTVGRRGKHDEPDAWRWIRQFDTRRTRHPYYHVENLLLSGDVDVIVQFTTSGPSGNLWADVPQEDAKHFGRREYASLWEIEPPTEHERQRYELLTQFRKAKSEEERAVLEAQLATLADDIEAIQAAHEAEAAAKAEVEAAQRAAKPKPAVQRAKQRHIRAVVYCRATPADDLSVAQQAEVCRALCEERGFSVVGTYEDTVSGGAIEAATAHMMLPGARDALDLIESGRADVLVVYSPDRIVADRNALDTELARLPLVTFVKLWQNRP